MILESGRECSWRAREMFMGRFTDCTMRLSASGISMLMKALEKVSKTPSMKGALFLFSSHLVQRSRLGLTPIFGL